MQKMVAQAIDVLTFTFWTWEVSEHYHHLTLPHLKTSVLLTQYFPRLHLSSGHPSKNNKPDLGRPSPTNTSRHTHHILVLE